MDIPPPFSVAMRLGEMAAFEIFEFFLSEKQNRGMLFECPSSHQETAMAERSRKSRPTAVFRAKQSGADELCRRLANSLADERGGKIFRLAKLENSENAERIPPRGSLVPDTRRSGPAPARKWRRNGLKRLNPGPKWYGLRSLEPTTSSRVSCSKWGMTQNVGVMPAKAGIQTWPRVPGLWIPAFAGMTQRQGPHFE